MERSDKTTLSSFKKSFSAFLRSLAAGLLIGIGGMVYLSCGDNRYVGALLFSVGLISILFLKMNLYTGMIGYLPENGGKFAVHTFVSLIGNFLAAFAVGYLRSPMGNVVALCEARLAKSCTAVLIDAILCGILIYLCVDIFKKQNKSIAVFLCIPAFILCGFEHCVADAFYFASARMLTASGAPLFLLLTVVGNSLGGMLLPTLFRLSAFLEKDGK